jgi:hypothetical protein
MQHGCMQRVSRKRGPDMRHFRWRVAHPFALLAKWRGRFSLALFCRNREEWRALVDDLRTLPLGQIVAGIPRIGLGLFAV